MEPNFWHERWDSDKIGFHRSNIHPALRAYWQKITSDAGSPVLVPLCGKSLDLRWLANRGHAVTGIELSEKAVREFFDEADLEAQRSPAGQLTRWHAGNNEIFEGDFFAWQAKQPFELFYDRAALIALPPEMRPKYLEHLRAQLADGAQGLLITLEYDSAQMDGPPFSVHEKELKQTPGFEFERLARENVLPTHGKFAERGLAALHECTYRVTVGK
ncbi:MAG: thiopurine S-methyltransferase [Wenzhouxiangellaceae bacterium]